MVPPVVAGAAADVSPAADVAADSAADVAALLAADDADVSVLLLPPQAAMIMLMVGIESPITVPRRMKSFRLRRPLA